MSIRSGVLQCGLAALIVVIAGCSGGTTIGDNPITNNQVTDALNNAVFTVRQSGGCVQIGPNCAVHTLLANGVVEARRNSTDTSETEVTGVIQGALLDNWVASVANENFDALLEALPPGRCAGCVDGIDYEYTVFQNEAVVTISSIDYLFDTSVAFFAITEEIYRAMLDAAPLDITRY